MKNCRRNYVLYFFAIYAINIFQVKADYENTFIAPKEKEIEAGTCDNAPITDLVFQDQIHKPGIPLVSRNATVTCHGDYKIYCVLVVAVSHHPPGTEVLITEGGLNHTYVTIEMHSKRGEGLDYKIQVYGKKLSEII